MAQDFQGLSLEIPHSISEVYQSDHLSASCGDETRHTTLHTQTDKEFFLSKNLSSVSKSSFFLCICSNMFWVFVHGSNRCLQKWIIWNLIPGAEKKATAKCIQRVRNTQVFGASRYVYDNTHHCVNMSYIPALMHISDPEKQLMYSLEWHCNVTTARCTEHLVNCGSWLK